MVLDSRSSVNCVWYSDRPPHLKVKKPRDPPRSTEIHREHRRPLLNVDFRSASSPLRFGTVRASRQPRGQMTRSSEGRRDVGITETCRSFKKKDCETCPQRLA
ncbi:hypothetical protein WN48_04847 [Eufriesea mexicana]|uniref:Uncharacterized protein n=1 Tax=Eufriesea mexicana TaxID=516756 RepID=A0A310S9R0_9HYME|nr:hypothetical protein WN48_04847 [Eufriesea mexicana]